MYGCESWTIKKAEHWYFSTVVLENTLQSPLDSKEIKPVNPKGNQSWIFLGRTDAEVETPILWPPDAKNWLIWKDPWERLKAGEGDDRRWDGWMASPTQWTWVWVNSGSWWWTGRPGVLQSMGSQTVGHNWATELNWVSSNKLNPHGIKIIKYFFLWGLFSSAFKNSLGFFSWCSLLKRKIQMH